MQCVCVCLFLFNITIILMLTSLHLWSVLCWGFLGAGRLCFFLEKHCKKMKLKQQCISKKYIYNSLKYCATVCKFQIWKSFSWAERTKPVNKCSCHMLQRGKHSTRSVTHHTTGLCAASGSSALDSMQRGWEKASPSSTPDPPGLPFACVQEGERASSMKSFDGFLPRRSPASTACVNSCTLQCEVCTGLHFEAKYLCRLLGGKILRPMCLSSDVMILFCLFFASVSLQCGTIAGMVLVIKQNPA